MKRLEVIDPVLVTKNILLNQRCSNCLWRAPQGDGINHCTHPTIVDMRKENRIIDNAYASTCKDWRREVEESSKWNVAWAAEVDA